MVLQKNTLFSGTIAENLRWGNAEATMEDIETVSEAAWSMNLLKDFQEDLKCR